jgi:hypothetical protein
MYCLDTFLGVLLLKQIYRKVNHTADTVQHNHELYSMYFVKYTQWAFCTFCVSQLQAFTFKGTDIFNELVVK